MWRKYIPEGMQDIVFEGCDLKLKIENTFREQYRRAGFEQVISPSLEFYDVFNGEHQPMEQEKMYKLFDNQGRILVLRPDMTTPIARIVATKLKEKEVPLKLCYTSNIFRVSENLNGKANEITQSGIEILGSASLKSDVEVIVTGINSLLAVGLKEFKIELGQAQYFKGLTEDLNMSKNEIEKIRSFIENKNYTALNSFIDEHKDNFQGQSEKILRELPSLFGGIDVLEKAKAMTYSQSALKALEDLEKIYWSIEKIGLGEYVSIDLGMVHHINYYTGIIFRGYSSSVGNNILSGGRYDKLLQSFDMDMPATGLAINVDNILISLNKEANAKTHGVSGFFIHYQGLFSKTAYDTAMKLRNSGFEAELSVFEQEDLAIDYFKDKNKKYFISFYDDNVLFIEENKEKKVLSLDRLDIELDRIMGEHHE